MKKFWVLFLGLAFLLLMPYFNKANAVCMFRLPVTGCSIYMGYFPNSCTNLLLCCEEQADCANLDPMIPDPCNGSTGIRTAIGCVPTGSLEDMGVWLGWWVMGIAGGICFLLIIAAAFLVITARGNADQIKNGTGILYGAISGLVFIVFAFFLLRVIGSDILKIPGL